MIRIASLLLVALLLAPAIKSATGAELEKEFIHPPDSARPWVYWWWINGNASKAGITRDFEEFKRQGIGGALLFDAGEAKTNDVPKGPPFMSSEWRELFKHAVREADRLGIVLTVNLCSGWNVGGPWVAPELAAKKLVSSQSFLKGPGRTNLALLKPPTVQGFYRDIAVLAMPVGDAASSGYKLIASSSQRDFPPELAEDGNDETRWVSQGTKPGMGPTPEKPEFLQFDYDEPRPAAGVWLKPYPDCGPKDVEVQCSDDGQAFRSLQRVTLKPREEKVIPFTETQAKHFRVVFLSAYPFRQTASWNVQVSEIELLMKDQAAAKRPLDRSLWKRSDAVDVTSFLGQDGRLNWDVPPGSWKVLRMGCTLTGRAVSNPGSGSGGLEIDPLSAEAMDAHFAETGAKLIADAGPLAGKTLQYFHIDSWEIGQPTWTLRMREEFQQRRGYDPLPWLPALLGQTVDNAAETRRFMQDFRRTFADLEAANYYGRLQELSVKGGLLGAHSEAGGPIGAHHFWADALQNLGVNAVPMGEFWARNSQPNGAIFYGPHNHTIKEIACAAHSYGKPLCQAESFTSLADDFSEDPWCLKDIGDSAFCEGLTRMVFHNWPTHLNPDAQPGNWWIHIGTHFGYNVTWWPMANGWLTYLARCQHLLRQGMFVADFAYLQHEAIPSFVARRSDQQPARPAGFDYDVLNAEALLTRASAKDGRLTLPDGMSYRYLVLPHQADALLSPPTLRKVNELAEAGVVVIGPTNLAAAVENLRVGPLDAVTRGDGLTPDIEFRDSSPGADFDWIHRRDGGAEIYFLSNQGANTATVNVAFRVAGKQPELWDAVTGQVRDLPDWREENGLIVVPLQFAPRQSWFVVFIDRIQRPQVREQKPAKNFPTLKPVKELAGPWEVQFDARWFYPADGLSGDAASGTVQFAKLDDWSQRIEPAIKHFSGTAVYRQSFNLKAASAGQVFLDLGVVKNVARVRLNGRDLGVVWAAPWQVEITDAVKAEANELEIEVANLWPNRLIGDAALPKDQRRTISNIATYDTKLSNEWLSGSNWGRSTCSSCAERLKTGKPAAFLSSGLLGPVRLFVTEAADTK